MRTTIPQIFEAIESAKGKEAKINTLRAYDHPVLRGVLQINFNPDVKVNLPEGEPPFKKDTSIPVGYSETNLYSEFRRMYIWLDNNVNITKFRKEQLFVQLLEGIHWSEAEAICLAKDKKLQTKYKSLKDDLIREALPGCLPEKAKIEKSEPATKKKASLNAS